MAIQNKSTASTGQSVRVANVNIPANKKVYISLQYIMGIGEATALKICDITNISKDKRIKELNDEELVRLRSHITSGEYKIEDELKREINANIANKISIGSYQGLRHRKGLPVRGQNTHSNARTRKGKAKPIAGKKKVTK